MLAPCPGCPEVLLVPSAKPSHLEGCREHVLISFSLPSRALLPAAASQACVYCANPGKALKPFAMPATESSPTPTRTPQTVTPLSTLVLSTSS